MMLIFEYSGGFGGRQESNSEANGRRARSSKGFLFSVPQCIAMLSNHKIQFIDML